MRLLNMKRATSRLSAANSSLHCSRQYLSGQTFSRIENILILGAGLMGTGIAQSCVFSGRFQSVTLHDISLIQLSKSRQRIMQNLTRQVEPKIDDAESIVSRITMSTKYYSSGDLTRNLLIIEAIPEVLALKQSLFKTLNLQFAANESVIIATCSANLAREDVSKYFDARHRFAGFSFNPEPSMKMVKIIRTADTDADTMRLLQRFVADIGKVCVVSSDSVIHSVV